MLAKDLIDRLERLALLDQEIIEALREQHQQSGNRVTPEAVAKLLDDNGQLTRFQATKLIGELRSEQYDDEDQPAEPDAATEPDDLTFLDDESTQEETEAIADAVPIAEAVPIAVPVDNDPMMADPIADDPTGIGSDLADVPIGPPDRTVRRPSGNQKSVWDSFKIYGYAGIIVLLCLAFAALYFVLSKGSADDAIELADRAYDQQSYQPAQESYMDFLDSYGAENQYSSRARTRITLTELYRAEGLPDPVRGSEVAQAELPKIADEPALNEDRDDLAALLTDIAENIADAADRSDSTQEKQTLLKRLDEQIEFMKDPVYVSSKMRVTLGGRLAAVAESRARVQREINRNLQLDDAVTAMTASLAEQETKAAYDTRFALLRDFPELRDNQRLEELIQEASEIQATLVASSRELPETTDVAVQTDTLRSIALTTLVGEAVPRLRSEIVAIRAGESVLAFSAEDGRLLWRKYVGEALDYPPIPVDGGDGLILTNGNRNEISLCQGSDGDIRWRSILGEPFSQPVLVDRELYVSGRSGKLYALDVETGDVRWVTQIPQALEASPGIDGRANKAYLPGDHSNLYVLNTRDGSCQESFYVGHAEGTISVAPVPLLGHLFVFENSATNKSKVHILKFDESGTGLQVAQSPVQLDVNVRVRPIVQKRRLIVLTDRGQVSVFDVEPSAERDKVSRIARCAPSYKRSTSTRMAASGSQMWITGTRIARFQLQINTGQVVRDWVKHEGDAFVGQPVAIEDTLIHARVIRGTSGIRVTAASPETGDRLWRVGGGMRVAMIQSVPGKRVFHAVTSQGALFEIDAQSISSGSTKGPIENPGGEGVAMRFMDPIAASTADKSTPTRILINREEPSEILLYDPSRTRDQLRKVTIQLPTRSQASGQAVVSGGGLLMPLDSGRIVLVRPQTGAMLGSPFQPVSDPTGTVRWTDPIPLAVDPDQVVIADSRNRLYRLRVGDQIRELSQVELESPLLGPATRIGKTMVATKAGPSADYVVGFDTTSLESRFEVLLSARVRWGPVSSDDRPEVCLLRTDDGLLRALDEQGRQQFQVELPEGEIVGKPSLTGENWLVTGKRGWIVVVDSSTGKVVDQVDIGQPISAPPLALGGGRLLVPGAEGVIYIVSL